MPLAVEVPDDVAGLGLFARLTVLGDIAQVRGEDDGVRPAVLGEVPHGGVERRPVTAVEVEQVLGVRDHCEREPWLCRVAAADSGRGRRGGFGCAGGRHGGEQGARAGAEQSGLDQSPASGAGEVGHPCASGAVWWRAVPDTKDPRPTPRVGASNAK
jgi:hypothetical protein